MASTNKTTNYELSQYVGSDKPTYLGDYNSDMLKIDTAMKANQTASATANSSITGIETDIGNMSLLETSATNLVGAINEVKVESDTNATNITNVSNKVGDVNNLNTNNKTNTVSAINEVLSLFNFTPIQLSASDLTPVVTSGTLTDVATENLSIAINTDGSMFKFYGEIRCKSTGASILKFNSSLRPTSDITFRPILRVQSSNGYDYQTHRLIQGSFTVKTNGDVEINTGGVSNYPYLRMFLLPCIYITKDFGDTPVQE